MSEEYYTRKELEEHMEMARLEGRESFLTEALNAVKSRADHWREQDRNAASQITTGFIKTRIAEDFEISEALLKLAYRESESS